MLPFLRWFYFFDIVIFLLKVGYLPLTRCSAQSDEGKLFTNEESDKEILDALLLESKYDPRIRPQNLTTVEINVLLHSLSTPDESSLTYEVEFLMMRKWVDPRLKYNDGGRHIFLDALTHVNFVWMPNTHIVKHGALKSITPDMSLMIYSNGTIIHTLRRGISINCQGKRRIFPFDNPKCSFAIESIALRNDRMVLKWSEKNPLEKASSLHSFNAYLIKSDIGTCGEIISWRGNYSCIHVLLVFTRDKIYYLSSVFAPGIILVTSAFMSFWLDKGVVPARVMIGVTTMLSFCTTTNNFRSSLPVVSSLTAMNLWDGVCMFFIYTSLLEFIIVNYLYRKPPKELPPESSFSRQELGESTQKEEQRKDKSRVAFSNLSSKELSFKIERIAKIVFPTSFAIFVILYFTVFAGILPNNRDNWEIQRSAQYKQVIDFFTLFELYFHQRRWCFLIGIHLYSFNGIS